MISAIEGLRAYLIQNANETLMKEIWIIENATKTALNYQKIIKSGMIKKLALCTLWVNPAIVRISAIGVSLRLDLD